MTYADPERNKQSAFVLTSLVMLLVFMLMILDGCGTFQRRAKDGSDLRGHCFQYAQLCTTDGTKKSPHGHKYTDSQLDLRCSRLDGDATLWGYSCKNYLP